MSYRNQLRPLGHTLAMAGAFLAAFTVPSYAYLDPGSASIIITAILGGIAAVGYTTRIYWERFKALFRRDKRESIGK